MPKIKVTTDGNQYILRDEEGMLYGKYPTRKLADERCRDWNEYYSLLYAVPTKKS
jgi:hypothetical protein